jgi:hypothetical protein
MIPFQSKAYYNNDMEGSYSIKHVLPALYPNDPELDYHSLDQVHNGGEASAAFLTMTNSQQLFDNTKQFVTAIVEVELSNDEDLKPIVTKNLIRNYLGTYIDYDMIDEIIEKSRQELELEAVKKPAVDELNDLGAEGL